MGWTKTGLQLLNKRDLTLPLFPLKKREGKGCRFIEFCTTEGEVWKNAEICFVTDSRESVFIIFLFAVCHALVSEPGWALTLPKSTTD